MQRPSLLKRIPCAALTLCAVLWGTSQAQQPDPIANLLRSSTAPDHPAENGSDSAAELTSLSTAYTATNLTQQAASTSPFLQPRTLDLISRPDDIWERIRNGFAIPNIDTPLVAQQQAWFLSHGDYFKRAIVRSSRYLYHIVEELEKRGMPTELALLPFIESAYNPMANSPAQASGMWQFIPSTGKDYNLKQNWWQDERRDIVASTDAALTYLQKVYEMQGDWHLALASYNWGRGAVKRAIEKNQTNGLPTDYLSLKMPDETRNYVPKLQAFKNIIANPELFGISLPKVDNQPYFATVNYSQGIDIMAAARLAEMPIDEFKALNPSFNRPAIPGAPNTALLLPLDKVDLFEANLENSTDRLLTWSAYTPKKGESLGKVASRFGMSLSYLQQVNGLSSKARLRPGTALLVQNRSSSQNEETALHLMSAPVLSYASTTAGTSQKTARQIAVSKNIKASAIAKSAKLMVKSSVRKPVQSSGSAVANTSGKAPRSVASLPKKSKPL